MKTALSAMCLIMVMCACSKKGSPSHESPKFLAVVDSICEKHTSDGGYNAADVKKGMHDYMFYYASNENPIFKDLPMTYESNITSKALDGSTFVTYIFRYSLEENAENEKRIYSLSVWVDKEFPKGMQPDSLKKGTAYIIEPENGISQYDGKLDILGADETPDGKIIDTRSFGTVKLKGGNFKPA